MTSAIDHLSVGMASNTTTSTTKLVIPEVPVLPTTKP